MGGILGIVDLIWSYFIYVALLGFLFYFLISFALHTIASKYNKNIEFLPFIVPIYRYYKVLTLIGGNNLIIIGMSANLIIIFSITSLFFGNLLLILQIITSISMGCFWGTMAKSMGKDSLLWGFLGGASSFFFITGWIPYAIFAFGSLQPIASQTAGKNLTNSFECSSKVQDGSASNKKQFFLHGINGIYAGQSIKLSGDKIIFGRDPAKSNLIIENPGISRCHASLRLTSDNSVLLEDLNSSNGTFYLTSNGPEKINGSYFLTTGDQFCLGSTSNKFEIR